MGGREQWVTLTMSKSAEPLKSTANMSVKNQLSSSPQQHFCSKTTEYSSGQTNACCCSPGGQEMFQRVTREMSVTLLNADQHLDRSEQAHGISSTQRSNNMSIFNREYCRWSFKTNGNHQFGTHLLQFMGRCCSLRHTAISKGVGKNLSMFECPSFR